jgi:predicted nucleic acid-binding protein
MTMCAKAFVDTNIVLRAFNKPLPFHEEANQLLDAQTIAGVELWISRQILREYLIQVTHPRNFPTPIALEIGSEQLTNIMNSFQIADETAAVTAQLIALLRAYPTGGKQIHDANIVATMLTNGVDTLLTMNVADFRRFEDASNYCL